MISWLLLVFRTLTDRTFIGDIAVTGTQQLKKRGVTISIKRFLAIDGRSHSV